MWQGWWLTCIHQLLDISETPFTLPHEAYLWTGLEVRYASWHGFSISVKTKPCQEAYLWSAPPEYLGEEVRCATKTSLMCSVKTQGIPKVVFNWKPTHIPWEIPYIAIATGSLSLVGAKKYTQCEDKRSVPLDRSSRSVFIRPMQRYALVWMGSESNK